jgi:hypothetical protein
MTIEGKGSAQGCPNWSLCPSWLVSGVQVTLPPPPEGRNLVLLDRYSIVAAFSNSHLPVGLGRTSTLVRIYRSGFPNTSSCCVANTKRRSNLISSFRLTLAQTSPHYRHHSRCHEPMGITCKGSGDGNLDELRHIEIRSSDNFISCALNKHKAYWIKKQGLEILVVCSSIKLQTGPIFIISW